MRHLRLTGILCIALGMLVLSACQQTQGRRPPPPYNPPPSDPGPSDPGPSDPGPSDPGPSDPTPDLDASLHNVPRPRVMIVATAVENLDEQRDDEAMALIEEVFQDLGFETIDAMQLAVIKDIDDALSSNNPDKILALRTRYGCEVVVACKYDKQFVSGGSQPNAMWYYLFNGKAVRTDTAGHIASKSMKSQRPRNSYNHFVDTAQDFARAMAEKTLKAWAREMGSGIRIQLMVSKGNANVFNVLTESLLSLPNVASAVKRRFQVDTCEFEVMYEGSKEDFVAALSTLTNPALTVIGFEANRVDAEISGSLPPPPADTTPPVVTITAPAEGSLLNTALTTVTGTVDDASIKSVRIGSTKADVNGGRFSASVSLAEGLNSLEASAVDAAGNRGSDKVTVTVDTLPPEVSIMAPSDGRKLSQTEVIVGVRVVSNDVDRVEVNGVAAELFREPDTYKANITVAEGRVTITAVAFDRAGNQGNDQVAVSVDTTPPEVDGKVTVIVSGDVDDPTHVVTVNGKTVPVNSDGTWETTVDITESKIVTIVATDEFGNETTKTLDYSK